MRLTPQVDGSAVILAILCTTPLEILFGDIDQRSSGSRHGYSFSR